MLEYGKVGVMEYWSVGVLVRDRKRKRLDDSFFPIIPSFQYSMIPLNREVCYG